MFESLHGEGSAIGRCVASANADRLERVVTGRLLRLAQMTEMRTERSSPSRLPNDLFGADSRLYAIGEKVSDTDT